MSTEQERFAAARAASVAEVLFRCARLWNERAIAAVNQQAGGPVLRAAHTALLPHLGVEGVRLTELAQRLDVSKQAVGQLVDELETMGVVARKPDPLDRRAKLVRLTPKGSRAMLYGLSVLATIERELAQRLGEPRLRELHAILNEVAAALL